MKKRLHQEVVDVQKDVILNQKLLLYLLSVCSEAEKEAFEALLSEDEKEALSFIS